MVDNTRKTGTGFTNLSKVISANQGNRLAQTVGSNVQRAGQDVQSRIQDESQKFKTEAEKNRLDTEQNKQFAQGLVQNIKEQPGANIQPSEDDQKRFEKIRQGIYQGPTQIGNQDALRASAERAQNLGNLTTSAQGRNELLRQTVGSPKYSYGQRRVDTLLLGQQPNQLSQARRSTQGLAQNVSEANRRAGIYSQELSNRAKQFGQEITSGTEAALGDIDTRAQQELQSAQAKEDARKASLESIKTAISGKQQAKVDASGNPVLDANGNPIMETVYEGGSTPYERLEYIANKIKGQNALNQSQFGSLFGQGNLAQDYRTRQADISDDVIKDKYVRSMLGEYNPETERYKGAYERDYRIWRDALERDDTITNRRFYNEYIAPYYKGEANKAFLSKTGAAGQALLGDQSPQLMKAIQDSITSKSQAAENLTKEGAASEETRAKYTALQKLLGKQGADLTYKDTDQRFKEGSLGLDAEQIKRVLGY